LANQQPKPPEDHPGNGNYPDPPPTV
jgi:hypothetical protein